MRLLSASAVEEAFVSIDNQDEFNNNSVLNTPKLKLSPKPGGALDFDIPLTVQSCESAGIFHTLHCLTTLILHKYIKFTCDMLYTI